MPRGRKGGSTVGPWETVLAKGVGRAEVPVASAQREAGNPGNEQLRSQRSPPGTPLIDLSEDLLLEEMSFSVSFAYMSV